MQLIIFDVDGTLVDSQHDIVEAQARAFADHGLPAPARHLALSVVGLSLPEAFIALAGEDGPIESLAEAYKEAWRAIRARPDHGDVLYAGAQQTLKTLSARPDMLLGIATGKSRDGVTRLIRANGWDGLFATVQTADTHTSKPDPSMILSALRDTRVAASEASMVGDTTYDMEMAVAAGVRPIGVGWGYHDRSALAASGADRVVTSFDELLVCLGCRANKAA